LGRRIFQYVEATAHEHASSKAFVSWNGAVGFTADKWSKLMLGIAMQYYAFPEPV